MNKIVYYIDNKFKVNKFEVIKKEKINNLDYYFGYYNDDKTDTYYLFDSIDDAICILRKELLSKYSIKLKEIIEIQNLLNDTYLYENKLYVTK